MLTGSGQNGKRIRSGGRAYPDEDVKPPVERHHLNLKNVTYAERGKPVFSPSNRQASRKTN